MGEGAGEVRVGGGYVGAGAVGEGDGRAEGGVEGAVGGEDVEFGGGVGLVLGEMISMWWIIYIYPLSVFFSFLFVGEREVRLTSPPYGHALVCFTVYLLAKSKAPSAIPR